MSTTEQQSNDGAIAAQAEFLLGRTRDRMLDEVKRHLPWDKLSEKKQKAFNSAIEQTQREAIRDIVDTVAAKDFDCVAMKVSGMKQTKEGFIEAKFTCAGLPENVLLVFSAGDCMLVKASANDFMNAKPAAVMKDQPDLLPEETPEAKADREATDAHDAEQERLLAGFKPTEDAVPLGEEVAKALGDKLPPKIKAAADRGRALRIEGGAFKIPPDLEGKPVEVNAFKRAWEMADAEGGAPEVEAVAEVPADTAKPPRGHRGKRTTSEERTAKRLASVAA